MADCHVPFRLYAEVTASGATSALTDSAAQTISVGPCGEGTLTFATVEDTTVTADREVTFTLSRWGTNATFTTTDSRITIGSPSTVTVTVVEDEAQGAPVINLPDPLEVGEHLSVDLSGITDADGVSNIASSATYNWQRYEADGTTLDTDAIGTGASYALIAADQGHRIRVQVSFTDDASNNEGPLSSALTAAVAASTKQAKISGRTVVGQTLTADTSEITDDDGLGTPTYTYQWQQNETNITGATSSTYVLQAADADQRISIVVSFTDAMNNAETRGSPQTSIIIPQWRKLVGSLGATSTTGGSAGGQQRFSQGFRPPTTAGSTFMVRRIRVQFSGHHLAQSRVPAADQTVTIMTANSSYLPQTLLATLTPTADANINARVTYNAPPEATVTSGNRYAVVFSEASSGIWNCTTTPQTSEDSDGLPGWDLDQRIYELNSSLAPFEVLNNQKCVISIEGHAVPADPILITRLAVSNAPADGTAFDTGDAINITATFSAAVTGELKLPVKIGNRTVVLEATAENSTTATFTHQVLSTDRDDDGITFDADRMTGTVNAVLAHPQLIASHAHSVNGLPTLRWVGITSDPGAGVWYTVGETIRADANFRRPIEVTGDPTLQFSTSAGATQMSYNAALSDEDSMVFTYLVQATDDDDNGIFIGANAIQLDSNDSIKDGWRTGADKKDAVITHGRPGANGFFRDHRISQQARISSVEVTSDPARGTNSDTYGYNDVIELTVTFNQDVTVTGDPVFKFSAGVFKDAVYSSTKSSGNTVVFEYTIQAADTDTNGIWIGQHGGGETAFVLDTDDSIQNAAGSDAVLNFHLRQTQGGHKVDGSINAP